MHPLLYKLMFHKAGKPRGWTRFVFFRKNGTARPLFYRVIHKKNGTIRPRWAYWATQPLDQPADQGLITAQDSRPEVQPLSAAEQTLRALRPFEQTVADWRKTTELPDLLTPDEIYARLSELASSGLVLSLGHDNYRVIPGGVQLCIQQEEKAATARNLTYLHLHPWQPLPCLADISEGGRVPVTLLLNGEMLGTTRMESVTQAIERCVASGKNVDMVVHHLMGHAPEAVADLARAAQVRDLPFWLHDFFTLCPSYTLQRNGLAFCGAPEVTSNACGLCVYGVSRPQHLARMAAFFEALPITAIAPSDHTAAFWSSRSQLPVRRLTTVPHMVLTETARPRPQTAIATNHPKAHPITVGYLGAMVDHKGWSVFVRMIHRFGGGGIRFVVLSDKAANVGEDASGKVHVTSDSPDAMSRAVREAKIDVVLHWASWAETFSFTTYEAMLGGAWVLTNPLSGNVQASVLASGRGAVLEDEAALVAFFADGGLERLVAERRAYAEKTELQARTSAMTFDLPGWSTT
ncbi:hypothetical protein [Pseudotabrizicola formosa]|uniref:hypothetical protein n=1 Tax=Pseudotabrizicola formosa TaxID=2030009 RepID=UPI0011AF9878|nr:hypothetical protein [Pseudotabrizicola formosa]